MSDWPEGVHRWSDNRCAECGEPWPYDTPEPKTECRRFNYATMPLPSRRGRPFRRCLAGDGTCQAEAFYVPTTAAGMQWFACEEHAAGGNICGDKPKWLLLISDFWSLMEARERRELEAEWQETLRIELAEPNLRRLRVALADIART